MNYIKNINWGEVASIDFWFGIDRMRIHASDKAFLYIGAALVTLSIIVFVVSRVTKNRFLRQVMSRFGKIFITIGLLEAFWYLLRTQYVNALGSKLIAAIILLSGIIWLYWPVKYLLRNYKEDMAQAAREASRDKYLNRK